MVTDKVTHIATEPITISNHAFPSTETELNFLTLIFSYAIPFKHHSKKGAEPLLGLTLIYQFENEMSHKTMKASRAPSDIIVHLQKYLVLST